MHSSFRRHLHGFTLTAAAISALAGTIVLPLAPASAQITVFDPSNYSQNLLTAARTLEQINNQIASLQNQAAMLVNQAKNLERVGFPELEALNDKLQQIDRLMSQARDIGFDVSGLEEEFAQLFPHERSRPLATSEQVAAARGRLDAAMNAYRQAMRVQAQVAGNAAADARVLGALASRSQGAEGALQAAQTTNQLLALTAKQQIQIQNLMAAQYRAQSTEAARRAQAAIDGRIASRKFLGDGSAYSPR